MCKQGRILRKHLLCLPELGLGLQGRVLLSGSLCCGRADQMPRWVGARVETPASPPWAELGDGIGDTEGQAWIVKED